MLKNEAWLTIRKTDIEAIKVKTDYNKISKTAEEFAVAGNIEKFNAEVVKSESGKPRFVDSRICFSLSHSKNYFAFLLAAENVGLDIQVHQENCSREQIAKRFFHIDEYEFLKRHNYEYFFDIWSAKESYVKFTGQGIDDDFGRFSVIDKRTDRLCLDGFHLEKIDYANDVSIFVCSKSKLNITKT